MKGNDLKLYNGTEPIGGIQSVSLHIEVKAEPYDLLPGMNSEEEEEWQHFRPGDRSWNVTYSGLLCEENADLTETADITIPLDTENNTYLQGVVKLAEMSIDAEVSALAKTNGTLTGEEFPEIYP